MTGVLMAQSEKITDIPDVVIKPGKMFTQWPLKTKVAAICFGLFVYAYFVLLLKGIYVKTKKFDHIVELMAQTEKLLEDVNTADQFMAYNLKKMSETG